MPKWLSISAQFHRKEKPKSDYLGLVRDNWTFCKDTPGEFHRIILAFIDTTIKFAYQTGLITIEQIDEEKNKIITALSDWTYEKGQRESR